MCKEELNLLLVKGKLVKVGWVVLKGADSLSYQTARLANLGFDQKNPKLLNDLNFKVSDMYTLVYS